MAYARRSGIGAGTVIFFRSGVGNFVGSGVSVRVGIFDRRERRRGYVAFGFGMSLGTGDSDQSINQRHLHSVGVGVSISIGIGAQVYAHVSASARYIVVRVREACARRTCR